MVSEAVRRHPHRRIPNFRDTAATLSRNRKIRSIDGHGFDAGLEQENVLLSPLSLVQSNVHRRKGETAGAFAYGLILNIFDKSRP